MFQGHCCLWAVTVCARWGISPPAPSTGFVVSCSTRSSNVKPHGRGKRQETQRQGQLQEDVLSSSSELRHNRLSKGGVCHFQYNNGCKTVGVHSRQAPLPSTVFSKRSGNELQHLCDQGLLDKAMDVLFRLEQEGTVPSVSMYRSILKACTKRKALARAKQVHAHATKHGLESTRFLAEYMVSTLVRCGGLHDGLEVFHRLPRKTVFAWTAIISGYAMAGQGQQALRMYYSMREDGLQPDKHTFVSLIKACGIMSDLEEGKRMHAEAVKYSCASELCVGTCLVEMYAKCGSIVDARNVFDTLAQRDVVSWTVIVSGYVQLGQPRTALQLYDQMLEEGVSPNDRTFVSTLQACGILAEENEYDKAVDRLSIKRKALDKGRAIHADAWRKGYKSDIFIGNTLISMYDKCGSIAAAQDVFDGLLHRDVVSWNAMLAAYVHQGQADVAWEMYGKMLKQDISPNARTYVVMLQACGMLAEQQDVAVDGQPTKLEALEKGRIIHADAWARCLRSDIFVGSSLVKMYSKCGSIVEAQKVFDGFHQPNVVMCNTMLAAYILRAQAKEALGLFDHMSKTGVSPDNRTFVFALQACSMLADTEDTDGQTSKVASLEIGRATHAKAWRRGYKSDLFVGNTLIKMYGDCLSIADAQSVFDSLPEQDVVSWSALLTAYALQNQAEKALILYGHMFQGGVSPDDRALVIALQACSNLAEAEEGDLVDGRWLKVKSLEKGKAIQAYAWRNGFGSNVFVASALVSMLGKCGSIEDARNVFAVLPEQNVVLWNVMLAAYASENHAHESLELYEQMSRQGCSPDDRTFVFMLQACYILADQDSGACLDLELARRTSIEKGKALHAEAWRRGYDTDAFLAKTLVRMYGKHGSIVHAEQVFHCMREHNVESWNVMLTAYVQQDQPRKAIILYETMLQEGLSPDDRTFLVTLQACSMLADQEEHVLVDGQLVGLKSLQKGKAIHVAAWSVGYMSNVFIGNTIVSTYGKCGSVEDARHVFNGLTVRDVVAWTAMLAAYSQQGHGDKALHLYRQMLEEGVSPNEVTTLCILQSCSNAGSLDTCVEIHQHLVSTGQNRSPLLASALIHAYGKCSSIVDAQKVLDVLPQPDLVSWSALIAGYARQGDWAASLKCYDRMRLAGIKPDGVTFLSLLSACSHAGLVEEGVWYFESMSGEYGITPGIEHYICLVDMLGRAGYFARIESLLSSMPMEPDLSIWLCLLGACQKHGKVHLGKKAFDSAVRLEAQHTAAYVLMINIYTDADLWDCAQEVNELRQKAGAWKKPGQSWIEYKQKSQKFVVGDCRLPDQEELYVLLHKLSSVVDEQRSPNAAVG